MTSSTDDSDDYQSAKDVSENESEKQPETPVLTSFLPSSQVSTIEQTTPRESLDGPYGKVASNGTFPKSYGSSNGTRRSTSTLHAE